MEQPIRASEQAKEFLDEKTIEVVMAGREQLKANLDESLESAIEMINGLEDSRTGMTHPGKPARDGRWRLSLTLLVTGALVFFGIFLTSWPRTDSALWEIAQDPLEYLDVGEGLAVGAFLLLTLLTLCSPAMAVLLARNGLMRNFPSAVDDQHGPSWLCHRLA